jgi:hypothetical protein
MSFRSQEKKEMQKAGWENVDDKLRHRAGPRANYIDFPSVAERRASELKFRPFPWSSSLQLPSPEHRHGVTNSSLKQDGQEMRQSWHLYALHEQYNNRSESR